MSPSQANDESTPLLSDADPTTPGLPKTGTNSSWPIPAGLPPRSADDETLLIFRRALGISHSSTSETGSSSGTIEEGRQCDSSSGIYASVLRHQHKKRIQYLSLLTLVYGCHSTQIVLGAAITILGPNSSLHSRAITILGAAQAVLAGFLALVTQQGLVEKLHKDEVNFKKLQSWIEETEALLALGIVGRDKVEVGALVEVAFKKYNSVEAHEETNQPDAFLPRGDMQSWGGVTERSRRQGFDGGQVNGHGNRR